MKLSKMMQNDVECGKSQQPPDSKGFGKLGMELWES